MRVRQRLCGLVVAVALVVIACDRGTPGSPTSPTAPSSLLVGMWSGPITDDVAGAGTLELTITQHTAISLFGTWRAAFGDVSLDGDGVLNGSVKGSAVSLTLTYASSRDCIPLPPTRPLLGVNLLVDATRMSGSFFGLSCGPLRGGRVELTKR